MFKNFFILVTILLFMGSVSSADYLTADPQSGDVVKKYRIELNGETLDAEIRTIGEGQVQLYYNADHLSDGKYVAAVAAGNDEGAWSKWGESLEFYRGIPTPQNIYLFCGIEEEVEPSKLSQADWKIFHVSSEDTNNGKYARLVIDGDVNTHWGSGAGHPHEIQIDLGTTYTVSGFYYTARQDEGTSWDWSGTILAYTFYVSMDGVNWDEVTTGELTKTRDEQFAPFLARAARYISLVALSEADGGAKATISELNILGY